MRKDFLEHTQDQVAQVAYMKKAFEQTLMPQFELMKEECRRATERTEGQEKRVDSFFSRVLELDNKKVNVASYEKEHAEINKLLDSLSFEKDKLNNSVI